MEDNLQKGGKGAAIGTRKTFGGKEYIRSADGWKYVGKGTGAKAKAHVDAHKGSAEEESKKTTTSPEDKGLGDHAKDTPTETLRSIAHDDTKSKEMRDAANKELKDREDGEKKVAEKHEETSKEDTKPEEEKKSESKPTEDKKVESKSTETKHSKESKSETPEEKGLPNSESVSESEILTNKGGAAKLSETKEGFSVDKPAVLTSESDEDAGEDDINHKFEAFGRFAAGVIKGRMKALVAYGSGGVGKATPNSTRIYTSNGYTTHGQVKPGDSVLNAQGISTTVLQIHPQGRIPTFEVQLFDNTTIPCSFDHLWKVWDKTNYWCKDQKKRVTGGRWRVITTEQLLEKSLRLRNNSRSTNDQKIWAEWRYLIPFAKPAQHSTKQQSIEPYLLGYLLGDGCLTRVKQHTLSIAVGDRDRDYFINEFSHIKMTENTGRQSFNIIGEDRKILSQNLHKLDLDNTNSWNKFIPQQYLYGDIDQRLSLIQGLMDTDGTVGKNGVCIYYSVSKQLAQHFHQIVKSFGMKASITHQQRVNKVLESKQSLCYEVRFQMPNNYIPFRLNRKVELYNSFKRRDDIRGQAIVSITQVEDQECTCITVSDQESLYLTEGYTVTHNTYTVTQELEKAGKKIFNPELHDAGDSSYDYVKMTGKMTAAAVYQAMYEHNGKLLLFDDCDSVLEDGNAINLFKGALDTSGDGMIDWGSAKKLKDSRGEEMPGKFPFNGRAIFISNLNAGKDDKGVQQNKQLQPIISRGYSIDLSMDKKKTMERIKHIATSKDGKLTNLKFPGVPDYDHEDMEAVFAYMDKHKDKASDLNVRTVGTLLAIKKDADEAGVNWQDDAKYVYLRKAVQTDIYGGAIFDKRKDAIEKAVGIDNRTIEDKKIDWCEMKKASLHNRITSNQPV